ncbi:Peptidase C48 [Macleaya cordata]|uniref:Peptidase C48 n=1 Tax=Macleaya cordata TaxID=56857 RepID=A0A200QHC1_MACCD|nr:Peptidase C48 [Macleaya cordata]
MEENISNKPLNLEWDKLLNNKDDGPPPELVVVTKTNEEAPPPSAQSLKDNLQQISDHDLSEAIRRIRSRIDGLSKILPDKGAKLRDSLKRHEEEHDRRKLLRSQEIADEGEKPMQSQNRRSSGVQNGFRSGPASSQAQAQSPFSSFFSKRLEEKPDCSTRVTAEPFEKELSYLGHGNHQNTRPKMLNKIRPENGVPSRQSPFKCPSSYSLDNDKRRPSNGIQKQKRINSSTFYSPLPDGNLSTRFSKRRKASQDQASPGSRSRKEPYVLVDEDIEEDCQPVEPTKPEDVTLRLMKEAKIYYPSRDDPESVELCSSDIECLAPEAFLSSTIMNFYIRYLQRPVSATGKSRADYHFFNTYFYEKLKEAVSYKTSDKDAFFAKFRRWWRGVNIFQKAYILLPIHENLHWSLVIICIPDKEDESGPIILHLDSLGYHDSRQIFQNIKSYLKEEWNFLNQGNLPPDLPIAERIWKHLPRRIDEEIITVPQQKNDYDCGIFVLFFMERFIEEAPERLKKKDLAMFGRRWFKPEEASGLRERIRKLLLEEFQNARIENDSRESSPASSDSDDSAECTVQPTDS